MRILPKGMGDWIVALILLGGAVSGVRSCCALFSDKDEAKEHSLETVPDGAKVEQRGSALDFDEITLGPKIGVHTYQVLKGKSVFDDPYASKKIVNDLVSETLTLAMKDTSPTAYADNEETPISYTDDGFTVNGKTYTPEQLGYTQTGWRTVLRLYHAHTERIKGSFGSPKKEQ